MLYWITNPLWVGGTLCFLASSAFSQFFIHLGGPKIGFLGHTPIFDLIFKLAFIWFSIGVAIAALDRGKWIPNFGALCRGVVLLFFSFTVLIYAFKHGIHGFGFSDFIPGATSQSGTLIFLGVVPLLLFNYVGFELANGAAEEMVDPQKDVPKSVIRSAIATVVLYSLPIFGILVVLPASKIKGIDGFVGRRQHRLRRRLRRRRAHARQGHGRRLHRLAHDVGRRLDDRLRPRARGGVLRRRLGAVVRRVQRQARHAGARQRDVRRALDRVPAVRAQPAERIERELLRGGAGADHVDDADLVRDDLPDRLAAAPPPWPRRAVATARR